MFTPKIFPGQMGIGAEKSKPYNYKLPRITTTTTSLYSGLEYSLILNNHRHLSLNSKSATGRWVNENCRRPHPYSISHRPDIKHAFLGSTKWSTIVEGGNRPVITSTQTNGKKSWDNFTLGYESIFYTSWEGWRCYKLKEVYSCKPTKEAGERSETNPQTRSVALIQFVQIINICKKLLFCFSKRFTVYSWRLHNRMLYNNYPSVRLSPIRSLLFAPFRLKEGWKKGTALKSLFLNELLIRPRNTEVPNVGFWTITESFSLPGVNTYVT